MADQLSRRGPRSIGTHLEIADRNLASFREALARAKAGGKGNVAVIQQKLDDWLDYRARHMADGTLDEEAFL